MRPLLYTEIVRRKFYSKQNETSNKCHYSICAVCACLCGVWHACDLIVQSLQTSRWQSKGCFIYSVNLSQCSSEISHESQSTAPKHTSKRHIACVCCQGNKARWLSFQHIRMVYIPMVLFAFFLMAERNMTNCTGLYRIVESGKWLPLLSPKKLVASGGLFGFWRTRQPELTLPTCNYNSFPRQQETEALIGSANQ